MTIEYSRHDDPIHDQRIIEAIEACRPESDDVDDPALAYLAAELAANPQLKDLFDRLQRLDAALAARIRDVSVPEGLQQRLLDRLAAARAEQAAIAPAGEKAEPAGAAVERPRRSTRRRILAVAGVFIAAAAVLVVACFRLLAPDGYDEQGVLVGAIQFFGEELNDPPEPGHLLEERSPPPGFPIGRSVARAAAVSWRPIPDFLGRNGVAYDMSLGGTKATLYVVSRPVAGLAARPGPSPGHRTAGCAASAWVEGGRMYVLVVHGDVGNYQRFLVQPGPLT